MSFLPTVVSDSLVVVSNSLVVVSNSLAPVVAPVVAPSVKPKTKNALTATSGNRAEALLCTQANVKTAFESYFGKSIKTITQIPGRKKADNRITFEDGTSVLIQNKNGKVEGRGHSVDRRKASLLTGHTDLHTLLSAVCLPKLGEVRKPAVAKAVSEECVALCLLGAEETLKPDYFLHTNLDASGVAVAHLSIVPAAEFLGGVVASLFPAMEVKKTCVHMSPHLYFQRKGGGTADHAPNDIQLKLRFSPTASKAIPHPADLFALFKALPLA
jgi:hypothetical protein